MRTNALKTDMRYREEQPGRKRSITSYLRTERLFRGPRRYLRLISVSMLDCLVAAEVPAECVQPA